MIYKNEKLRRVLQQLSETMPAAAALLIARIPQVVETRS